MPLSSAAQANRDTLVIGASAGGIPALRQLLGALPVDLPAAVLVVMHQGRLAGQLDTALRSASALPLGFVSDPVPLENGHVYLAPPDRHLVITEEAASITAGPREMRTRPAINPLFRTAAAARGSRVIAIQLTGLLDDGVAGLDAVRRCGGLVLVQDPHEAEYAEMPQAAIDAGPVDLVGTLDTLAARLPELVAEPAPEVEIPADVATEARLSFGEPSRPASTESIGEQVPVACPDCGGPLWQVGGGESAVFRCHVGHALSARAVLEAQADSVERSLWVAVRSLAERAAMLEKLAENTLTGNPRIAADYRDRAQEAMAHSENARRFLLSLQGGLMPARDILTESVES